MRHLGTKTNAHLIPKTSRLRGNIPFYIRTVRNRFGSSPAAIHHFLQGKSINAAAAIHQKGDYWHLTGIRHGTLCEMEVKITTETLEIHYPRGLPIKRHQNLRKQAEYRAAHPR